MRLDPREIILRTMFTIWSRTFWFGFLLIVGIHDFIKSFWGLILIVILSFIIGANI